MEEIFENDNPNEKFCTCRLKEDEMIFLKEHWNNKFSEYVHSCIERDISTKKNKKTMMFKDFNLYAICMGLGIFFFMFGHRSISALEMGLSYVIGFFLLIYGIAGGMLVALQSTRRTKQ